jgi:hypothetical protein
MSFDRHEAVVVPFARKSDNVDDKTSYTTGPPGDVHVTAVLTRPLTRTPVSSGGAAAGEPDSHTPPTQESPVVHATPPLHGVASGCPVHASGMHALGRLTLVTATSSR